MYADWLVDHGDDRGELIVLKHRLATRSFSADERQQIQQRIQEIRRIGEPRWRGELTIPRGVRLKWKHGFVVGARMRFGALGRVERLAGQPGAWALSELNFGYQSTPVGDGGVTRLARSPAIRRVTRLDLNRCALTKGGARTLATDPAFAGLVTLNLADNQDIGNDGARALWASSTLGGLRGLDLHSVGAPGLVRALRDPPLAGLARLRIGQNGIGDREAAALAEAPGLGRLTYLDLSGSDIGNDGARALAGSTTLVSLADLHLRFNRIGRSGAIALLRSRLPLIRLDLSHNRVRLGQLDRVERRGCRVVVRGS